MKSRIGGLLAFALRTVARVALTFANRITNEPDRQMAVGGINWFVDWVNALSDANPDDSEQIRDITNKFFTDSPFAVGSRATIRINIEKIKNERVRTIFSGLVPSVYNAADLLTDENEDNGTQLVEMAKSFGTSEDGLDVLVALFGIMFDEEIALLIAEMIQDYLEQEFAKDPVAASAKFGTITPQSAAKVVAKQKEAADIAKAA